MVSLSATRLPAASTPAKKSLLSLRHQSAVQRAVQRAVQMTSKENRASVARLPNVIWTFNSLCLPLA
eukprot:590829-Prymnesium_polylepis.1